MRVDRSSERTWVADGVPDPCGHSRIGGLTWMGSNGVGLQHHREEGRMPLRLLPHCLDVRDLKRVVSHAARVVDGLFAREPELVWADIVKTMKRAAPGALDALVR